ncbi:MAG TPA: DUF3418 domain-containing protein, partial [Verrucomicrobiae bacterium]
FTDPQSDFLSLLNIWNAVHEEWEKLRTQNQRRKFCKQHFLSYLRMSEWQDLFAQLHDALADLGTLKLNESNAAYEAIHRSILAGLIGHVARHEERNTYKAAANRLVSVFPGSALYARGEPTKKFPKGAKPTPKPKSNQPEWIVAGEIVETSQLFARTVAGIDPQWIFQLAPHCCKVTHQNPHWSATAGRVLADEIVTLNGLEVQRRKIAYGNINPREAAAIFIRSALVEENLLPNRPAEIGKAETIQNLLARAAADEDKPELPAQYQFLTHNRAVREKIENWRTRVRRYDLGDLEQALCAFYAKHLENVSSIHELNRFLRDSAAQNMLCVSESELTGGQALAFEAEAFPDSVSVAGQPVALVYSYAPGEEHDGVTIKLPFSVAQTASASLIEWAVPGLRAEMISELLRALPKAIRKELMPFPPKVAEIVRDFQPGGASFLNDLGAFLHRRYGVPVPVSAWPANALPAHLRPRIEVIDDARKTLGSGRDLPELRQRLESVKVQANAKTQSSAWNRATQQWERFGVSDWNFGDLPERVTVSESEDLPIYAWPGLEFAEGSVNVRLFRTPTLARDASLGGLQRLIELAIQRDLGWLEKDLRALNKLESLFAPLGNGEQLREDSLENLKRHILPYEPLSALTKVRFDLAVEASRKRLPGLAIQFMDRLEAVLKIYQQVRQRLGAAVVSSAPRSRTLNDFSQLAQPAKAAITNPFLAELNALVSSDFLKRISYDRLPQLPRYLKALLTRIERAALNPVKDQERQRQIAPFQDALKKLQAQPPRSAEARRELETFRWMIEEFKVSLFAQELGTAMPVSAKRLDQQLAAVRQVN